MYVYNNIIHEIIGKITHKKIRKHLWNKTDHNFQYIERLGAAIALATATKTKQFLMLMLGNGPIFKPYIIWAKSKTTTTISISNSKSLEK